jgi:hypothetical protein
MLREKKLLRIEMNSLSSGELFLLFSKTHKNIVLKKKKKKTI